MRRVVALGLLLGAVASGWSCIDTCTPGRTEACACTDGRTGAQVCRSNGAFDPCICTGSTGLDGGEADAGADCSRNFNAPYFQTISAPGVASVALGQPVKLTVLASDPEQDLLTTSWSTFLADGGAADASVSGFAGRGQIQFPEPGNYEVEVAVSDGCHTARKRWPIAVLPAVKIPFVIDDFACCDAEGRGFAINELRAEVVRLSPDAGIETLALPRLPKSVTLDSNRSRLVVGEDGYVSFIRLADFTAEYEWPVEVRVEAAIANDTEAWLFGRFGFSSSDVGIRLAIDGGTVIAENRNSAPAVKRGFFSADERWFVIDDGAFLRTRAVASGLSFVSAGDFEQGCGALWETGRRARFFSGCGAVYEVRADGGLANAGMLPAITRLDALGESPTGDVSVTWREQSSGTQVLRTVNGSTLSAKSEFPIGLSTSDLERSLKPGFLMPQANGHVHVFTPDTDNAATWWQEF